MVGAWSMDRSRWRRSVVVVGTVLGLAVPYLLLGPGWFREDHPSLANVAAGGGMDAAGDVVGRNRPVTALVYSVVFGALGEHPAVVFVLVTILIAIAAVLLMMVLEPVFGTGPAIAAALLYAISPSQSSITHWASTSNVLVTLILLLLAILVIQRGDRWLLSGALVAVGILSYEAIVPCALLAWLALYVVRRPSPWRPVTAVGLTVPAIGWVSSTSTNDDPYLLRLRDGINSLFGWGLTGISVLAGLITVAVLIGASLLLGRWATGRVDDDAKPEQLTLAGLVTIGAGWAPFLFFGFGMDFTGQGDRANFVAVIGASMIFVGLGWRLARTFPPSSRAATAGAMAVLTVVVLLPTRIENDRDWASVWDETRTVLENAEPEVDRGTAVVHLTDCPVVEDGVQGLDTSYAATNALRWWTDDLDVLAQCGDDEIAVSGTRRRPAGGP